jgi:protein disulfide-isomerase
MKPVLALAALLFAFSVHAAVDGPYNEAADAKADIRQALAQGGDCRMLDTAMKTGKSASLIRQEFRVVKVDVGKFDRNVDVAAAYGVPLKKGIPAAVVLSAEGKVLHATRSGELADARNMGEDGVYEYFRKVVAERK